jgi:hypothetical protein
MVQWIEDAPKRIEKRSELRGWSEQMTNIERHVAGGR